MRIIIFSFLFLCILHIIHRPAKEQHIHPSARIIFTETRTYREVAVDWESVETYTDVNDVWSVWLGWGTIITWIGNEDVEEGVPDNVGVTLGVDVAVAVFVELDDGLWEYMLEFVDVILDVTVNEANGE